VASPRLAPLWIGFAVLLVAHGQAQAYTGGPLLVDVLGWDANAHRVYFHTIPDDEGNRFGAVYYFHLDGAKPERRIQVPWSVGEAEANDPDRTRRLQSLRSRLRPLLPKPEASLGWGTIVLRADSLNVEWLGKRPRFRLLFKSSSGPRFAFTGYEQPDASLKDTYEIPGRREILYVLAFRGNPHDVAETQVAVLVPVLSDSTFDVNWEPDK
jgi:hypothetical protein